MVLGGRTHEVSREIFEDSLSAIGADDRNWRQKSFGERVEGEIEFATVGWFPHTSGSSGERHGDPSQSRERGYDVGALSPVVDFPSVVEAEFFEERH